jgi:hypothetical protein
MRCATSQAGLTIFRSPQSLSCVRTAWAASRQTDGARRPPAPDLLEPGRTLPGRGAAPALIRVEAPLEHKDGEAVLEHDRRCFVAEARVPAERGTTEAFWLPASEKERQSQPVLEGYVLEVGPSASIGFPVPRARRNRAYGCPSEVTTHVRAFTAESASSVVLTPTMSRLWPPRPKPMLPPRD